MDVFLFVSYCWFLSILFVEDIVVQFDYFVVFYLYSLIEEISVEELGRLGLNFWFVIFFLVV